MPSFGKFVAIHFYYKQTTSTTNHGSRVKTILISYYALMKRYVGKNIKKYEHLPLQGTLFGNRHVNDSKSDVIW